MSTDHSNVTLTRFTRKLHRGWVYSLSMWGISLNISLWDVCNPVAATFEISIYSSSMQGKVQHDDFYKNR